MFTNVFFIFVGTFFFHLCCQRRGSLLVCIVQTTFTYREGNGTQHNLKINTSVHEHWTVNSREKKKPTDRKTDKPNQHSCSTQSTSLTALTDKLRLKVCHVMRQTKEQVVKVIWQQAASPPHMDDSTAFARLRQSAPPCFLGPTRVQIPNGISIGSAVFAGLTAVTDRPTDRLHYSICNNRPHYVRSTAMQRTSLSRTWWKDDTLNGCSTVQKIVIEFLPRDAMLARY